MLILIHPANLRRGAGTVCALLLGLGSTMATGDSIVAMNCGEETGGTYAEGRWYSADRAWGEGDPPWAGHVGGSIEINFDWDIEGTTSRNLHREVRTGFDAYRVEVDPGAYLVTLHLVERTRHGPHERVFDVVLEGVTAWSNVDLVALVGKDYAIAATFLIEVEDGVLDIELPPVDGSEHAGTLAGFSVSTAEDSGLPPEPVDQIAAIDGYQCNILSWQANAPGDGAVWSVERDIGEGYDLLTPEPTRSSRWIDLTAPVDVPSWYRVTPIDPWGRSGIPTVAGPVTAMAEASSLLEPIEIWMAAEELAELDRRPFRNFERPAIVLHDGEIFDPTLARYRGGSSRHYYRKSWRLESDTEVPFHPDGCDLIFAQGPRRDRSYVRDHLSFDLYRGLDIPTPEGTFHHLILNDRFYGVAYLVEPYDSCFLERRGFDGDSGLYKCDRPFEIQDSAEIYEKRYERQTGDKDDYRQLIRFVELLNHLPDDAFPAAMHQIIETAGVMDYYAMTSLLGDCCSIDNNFYVMRDDDTKRWSVLPWDKDTGFSGHEYNPPTVLQPIDWGMQGVGPKWNVLTDRTLRVPAFRDRFCNTLASTLESTFTPEIMHPRIDAVMDEIEFDVWRDVLKRGREDPGDFIQAREDLKTWIGGRRTWLGPKVDLFRLEDGPWITLNEVLPFNLSGETDEAGDHDPWIELWNEGIDPVDLTDWSLESSGDTWTFPDETSIGGGDHLVIWLDGEPEEGPWHASFTIDGSSGTVGLRTGAGEVVDTVSWTKSAPDRTSARRPDGRGAFLLNEAPSFGTWNHPLPLSPTVSEVNWEPAQPAAFETIEIAASIEAEGPMDRVEVIVYEDDPEENTRLTLTLGGDGRYHGSMEGAQAGETRRFYIEAHDDRGYSGRAPEDAPFETWVVIYGQTSTGIVINEFMASNDSTIADEAGEFDDWIELYNASDEMIDLSGMFLSDDLTDSTKWEIPMGTELASGSWLLFWADDDQEQGPNHTTFKLSAGGEDVAIFATEEDGNGPIDGRSYGAQTTDVSEARLADGGSTWDFDTSPTPGGTNDPATHCPEDLDGDGSVTISDLLAVIDAWGQCPEDDDCPADFDGSGAVTISDLLSVIDAWGACPSE